jgi:C4-dicarboxylate-specific signal transduction histidine kinase
LKHAQQTGIIAAEYRVVWPDGSIHWLAASGRMFFDDEGRPFRMVGFTADVTRRKMVEEELRHSEEALDKARSELAHVTRIMSLGALTASIAHEVNQPLSGIITNASTCMRMLDADPPNVDGARETARRTIRDGHRAADVIARLRALFSKKDVTSELVDLNQATREVIALSRRELERNRVLLRTQLADNLPRVTGDRVQLQQVILNLLRNSSDAMSAVNDRPRELVFKTELDDGDRVCLSVRDTGKGFDQQTMDQLFHAFYTTKDGGMGMGLSVSRSIIENHQGRLWATPNDGPGVTFTFSIPRTIETHEVSPGGIDMKDQKRIARKG